jgi:hypothetical protein
MLLSHLFGLFFLFGTGGCVAWCALQFRLPAPFVLGPLLSTALLWSLDVNISFPTNVVSFLSKITIGSFIGLRFDRNCAKLLGNLAWPSILQSFWMLSTSLVCAFLLYTLTDLPLSTALLGSTTGGVAEMALFALSLNVDVANVTILQVFRLVASMFVIPLLSSKYSDQSYQPCRSFSGEEKSIDSEILNRSKQREYFIFISLAMLGGWIGTISNIPAGALLGSMVFVGLFCAFGVSMWHPPKFIRSIAQIGVGITIGMYFTRDTFYQFFSMFFPILLLSSAMIVSALVLGFLLKKFTNWNLVTCLLSAAPAGLTQMGAIAEEMGADPLIVSLMHTVRLVSILVILPILFSIFLD